MFDRFNSDARALLMFAGQEAQELGSREIGTDHLILGMLGNARSPLFAVLTDQGLTLAAAREVVKASGADAPESTQDRYDEDREALRTIGIDLDKLRAAVGDRFGEDLSEGWGERPRRGRPGGHGRGCGEGQRGGGRRMQVQMGPDGIWFGPAEGGGRGRRGPRGRGPGSRLSGPAREAIKDAFMAARENHDHDVNVARLLLAILDGGDPAAIAVVESATTVENLRAAVAATMPVVAP